MCSRAPWRSGVRGGAEADERSRRRWRSRGALPDWWLQRGGGLRIFERRGAVRATGGLVAGPVECRRPRALYGSATARVAGPGSQCPVADYPARPRQSAAVGWLRKRRVCMKRRLPWICWHEQLRAFTARGPNTRGARQLPCRSGFKEAAKQLSVRALGACGHAVTCPGACAVCVPRLDAMQTAVLTEGAHPGLDRLARLVRRCAVVRPSVMIRICRKNASRSLGQENYAREHMSMRRRHMSIVE